MALATQCPMCETVFRITTAQAAAKSGTVRCGQCFSVFNALDVLVRVEDLEFDREPSLDFGDAPTGAAANGAPSVVPAPPPTEPDEMEVDPVVESPDAPATAREWWLPAEGESIVTSPPVRVQEREAETSLAERRLHVGWTKTKDDDASLTRDPEARSPRSRAERVTLAVLSLVAAIALLGQMTYAWRDEIAARWPATRTTLDAICANVGCRVQAPMHLEAITIESTNVEATAPNSTTFVLTTLLRNRDPVDVRFPSLALTLTDAQDQPILRRVLRPEDYLAIDRPPREFAAGSELPIRVTFETTDLRFLGYRLERFYP
jgi:predicted Zn finger-like uncharacterized protein